MARIAGVDLPRDKRVVVSLTYIYGIGRSTSEKILAKSDATVESATEEDYQYADSVQRQMLVRVKVQFVQ